jgi:hypothetical protein
MSRSHTLLSTVSGFLGQEGIDEVEEGRSGYGKIKALPLFQH